MLLSKDEEQGDDKGVSIKMAPLIETICEPSLDLLPALGYPIPQPSI